MRPGPKRDPIHTPLDLRTIGRMTGPGRVAKFIEAYCRVPRGVGAGELMKLRPFQKEFIRGAFADDVMVAGFSVPRGSGKTQLCACLAVYALYGTGIRGPRVYCCATSERQAMILYGEVKAMVEMCAPLLERSQVHQDHIVVPGTDGLLSPLPASPKSLLGHAPALVVIDEMAEVDEGTFANMQTALGKTPGSKLIGISTAPTDPDSSWNRLRDLGREGTPGVYWREWSAPEGCDPSDPAVWAACNPAYGDFLDPAAVASSFRTTRLETFMRYRLNMPVEDAGVWIPWGVFEALADPRPIPDGSTVVLGFDGSIGGINADCTAIVAVSVDQRPHCQLVSLWEAPTSPSKGRDANSSYQVPRAEVEAVLAQCMDRWSCIEIAADPHHWISELQAWEARGWPIISWATHVPQRMQPATDAAYSLITEGRLSHSGDPRLVAHVRNCVIKTTSAGPALVKDAKMSRKKIDAAVALVIGIDRALFHAHQPVKRYRVGAF